MESICTKTKKLPTTEQNYDLLLGKDLSVAKSLSICTKEFGIFIFSGGVSFTK